MVETTNFCLYTYLNMPSSIFLSKTFREVAVDSNMFVPIFRSVLCHRFVNLF